jgi:hypothetical protein
MSEHGPLFTHIVQTYCIDHDTELSREYPDIHNSHLILLTHPIKLIFNFLNALSARMIDDFRFNAIVSIAIVIQKKEPLKLDPALMTKITSPPSSNQSSRESSDETAPSCICDHVASPFFAWHFCSLKCALLGHGGLDVVYKCPKCSDEVYYPTKKDDTLYKPFEYTCSACLDKIDKDFDEIDALSDTAGMKYKNVEVSGAPDALIVDLIEAMTKLPSESGSDE